MYDNRRRPPKREFERGPTYEDSGPPFSPAKRRKLAYDSPQPNDQFPPRRPLYPPHPPMYYRDRPHPPPAPHDFRRYPPPYHYNSPHPDHGPSNPRYPPPLHPPVYDRGRRDYYSPRYPMYDKERNKKQHRRDNKSPSRDNASGSDYDSSDSEKRSPRPSIYNKTRSSSLGSSDSPSDKKKRYSETLLSYDKRNKEHSRQPPPPPPDQPDENSLDVQPDASNSSTLSRSTTETNSLPPNNLDIKQETSMENTSNTNGTDEKDTPDEPAEDENILIDMPALPSKEDLLSAIERIDIEITKVQIEIETTKKARQAVKSDHALPETPKKKTPTRKRNKVQQIYYENREKAKEACDVFDFLLQDKSTTPLHKIEPCDAPIFKQSSQSHNKFLADIEQIIQLEFMQTSARNKAAAETYKKLRREWRDKMKQIEKCKEAVTSDNTDIQLQLPSSDVNKNPDNLDQTDLPVVKYITAEKSKRYRKTLAIIPPMLSEEERSFVWIDSNGSVEDCLREYNDQRILERSWTSEDKQKFLDLFAQFSKDLKRIASYYPNKTMGDIVAYYYNNKNSSEFKKLMKEINQKRRYRRRSVYDEGPKKPLSVQDTTATYSNYLRPRGRPSRATQDDVYIPKQKDASPTTASADEMDDRGWTAAEKEQFLVHFGVHGKSFTSIAKIMKSKTANQLRQYYNENNKRLGLDDIAPKKPRGRPRKKPIEQPTPSTTQTDSSTKETMQAPDHGDKAKNATKLKKQAPKRVSYWSAIERENFLNHFEQHGRNWKKIAELMQSKTQSQIKNFFHNFRIKLGLAVESKGIRKKKKKSIRVITQDSVDHVAPDLCNLANIADEISERGDTGIADLRSTLQNYDSPDSDESNISVKRRPIIFGVAPPIRPRSAILGMRRHNPRPTLKLTSIQYAFNQNGLDLSKKAISQQELANLELLSSLAADEAVNSSIHTRRVRNDRNRTSITRTPSAAMYPSSTLTGDQRQHNLFQQQALLQHKTNFSQDAAPVKPAQQTPSTATMTGPPKTTRDAKDRFFTNSTFITPANFYPNIQPFMMSSPLPSSARPPAVPTNSTVPQQLQQTTNDKAMPSASSTPSNVPNPSSTVLNNSGTYANLSQDLFASLLQANSQFANGDKQQPNLAPFSFALPQIPLGVIAQPSSINKNSPENDTKKKQPKVSIEQLDEGKVNIASTTSQSMPVPFSNDTNWLTAAALQQAKSNMTEQQLASMYNLFQPNLGVLGNSPRTSSPPNVQTPANPSNKM